MRIRRNVNQPPRGNLNNPYGRARLRTGLTQEEACQKLHISTRLLSAIENGKYNPTPDIAVAMAKLYNDDRLPREICRKVCAIDRARMLPFKLNLRVVIPLMMKRLDEIQGILNQLPDLLEDKESIQDFSPPEWKLLMDYADRIRKFARDVEILEVHIDRLLEEAEKKTAFAAR